MATPVVSFCSDRHGRDSCKDDSRVARPHTERGQQDKDLAHCSRFKPTFLLYASTSIYGPALASEVHILTNLHLRNSPAQQNLRCWLWAISTISSFRNQQICSSAYPKREHAWKTFFPDWRICSRTTTTSETPCLQLCNRLTR